MAWPIGEALIIVGADGAGKTALAFNLMIRQLAITNSPLLGLTVLPRTRILYLAQDRPRQAQRALRRMVGLADVDTLNEGLRVIDRPLESFIEDDPGLLVRLADEHKADTLYVDSLKDVVRALQPEESGLAVRKAYSMAIAEGVEVCILHHDRKEGPSPRRHLIKLADVFGSRFLTAGAGSVIGLNGGSGDPIIDLRHLKQPAQEVGPLKVSLDFETGELNIFAGSDLTGILRAAKKGVTAQDAARLLLGTDHPTQKDRERVRRKLEGAVGRGLAHKVKGDSKTAEVTYFAVDDRFTNRFTEAETP